MPESYHSFLKGFPNVNILFVDDGSNDDTLSVIEAICLSANQASYIRLEKNFGKAEAVRRGICKMLEKQFTFIGYFDADLSTDLSVVKDMVQIMVENPKIQLVMGSRISKLGCSISRRWYRHLIGRLVTFLLDSMSLKLDAYDTQCGAKLMHANLVQQVCTQRFVTKWLVDVEIISRMIAKDGRENTRNYIFELPLCEWHHQSNSKIGIIGGLCVAKDLINFFWTYRNIGCS